MHNDVEQSSRIPNLLISDTNKKKQKKQQCGQLPNRTENVGCNES